MVSPECLYWLILLFVVLPSARFNRVAVVVLLVWALGHLAHIIDHTIEDDAWMFARIVGFGAALGLSKPWEWTFRTYANVAVAILFLPNAYLAGYSASHFHGPPATMAEYDAQVHNYYFRFTILMVQALLVPVGNDWHKASKMLKALDNWLMEKLASYFAEEPQ